jgi:hypothetical protein
MFLIPLAVLTLLLPQLAPCLLLIVSIIAPFGLDAYVSLNLIALLRPSFYFGER